MNDIIIYEGMTNLTGYRLKIDTADAKPGIYFIAEDGKEMGCR